jgi:hypothetical protein
MQYWLIRKQADPVWKEIVGTLSGSKPIPRDYQPIDVKGPYANPRDATTAMIESNLRILTATVKVEQR